MRYFLPLLLLFILACQSQDATNTTVDEDPTPNTEQTEAETTTAPEVQNPSSSDNLPDEDETVNEGNQQAAFPSRNIPIILDTDANNEIDDQHALAYLLLNPEVFNVLGVTVNATELGGNIQEHYAEAERVIKMCGIAPAGILYSGANGNFEVIRLQAEQEEYDGMDAVEFIIETARKYDDHQLALVPVGKLTNIALALALAPDIKDKVRIVWLGANYPSPGEYNLENDIAAMNYVLEQDVPFEMVTVRYEDATGSTAVSVTPADMEVNMPGLGPLVSPPVAGRHGGSFSHFGDYSLSLFEQVELHGDPPSRSLFDVVALAIMKNPDWGKKYRLSAPVYQDGQWIDRPENPRLITIWENFDKTAILEDFFGSLKD